MAQYFWNGRLFYGAFVHILRLVCVIGFAVLGWFACHLDG